jgi:hypothetical protein
MELLNKNEGNQEEGAKAIPAKPVAWVRVMPACLHDV